MESLQSVNGRTVESREFFDQPGRPIYENGKSYGSVRILGGGYLTLSGCKVDRLEIDRIQGDVHLNLIRCKIGALTMRRLGHPGNVRLMITEGELGQVRIEGCRLASLRWQGVVVEGTVLLKSLHMDARGRNQIRDCKFGQNFYLEGLQISHAPDTTQPIDLRQNKFGGSFKLWCPGEVRSLSLKGASFAGAARICLQSLGDAFDMSYATTSSELELKVGMGAGRVVLDGARLRGRAHILATAQDISAQRASLEGGGRIEASGRVDLAGALIGASTTLTRRGEGRGDAVDCSEHSRRRFPDRLRGRSSDDTSVAPRGPDARATPTPERGAPRLLSLRNAEVAPLRIIDADLRECHFEGAWGLDRASIDVAPESWPHDGRRRVIADEMDARRGTCWHEGGRNDPPPKLAVAASYRHLRSTLDLARDQPGAADFYFGEMEMRRLAHSGGSAAGAALWVYWLTSGYGVRPMRVLVTLLGVLAAGGLLLAAVGLAGQAEPPLLVGFLTAIEMATFRASDQDLTSLGRAVAVPLRLIAPLLFLQFILALRAYVRR